MPELNQKEILKYYSRQDIQHAILTSSVDREVAVKFGDKGYGKRPDILQYRNDILEFAQQGATSFHLSEERWHDALQLSPGLTRSALDKLRKCWDLVLDIDSPFLEYSRSTASLLVEALLMHNISEKSIGCKYSGNRGFHLSITAESMPAAINNNHTRLLFPEGPRAIASYLKSIILDELRKKILEINPIEEIAKATGKSQKDIIKANLFDPYTVVDIDTIAISSRHLLRAPYSINEKSGLVSVPITPSQLKHFSPAQAKMSAIEPKIQFFKHVEGNEASQLFMQSLDYAKHHTPRIEATSEQSRIAREPLTKKINPECFPPCIQHILKGISTDGRKRAIFILMNFLKQTGHSHEEIQNILLEWNRKNYEPLKENLILGQLNYHKKNPSNILPPNCNNQPYYISMGICHPDSLCSTIKNPVNYAIKRSRLLDAQKKPQKKIKSKSTSAPSQNS